MEIILADNAGFCFGVSKAVNTAFDLAKNIKNVNDPKCDAGEIFTLGAIIHNKNVINELAENGVHVIESVENIDKGSTVVIRTHGVSKDIYDKLNSQSINIIDATCPFVKKIHKLVREKHKEGYGIIIIGDPEHPEVKGINGWCENSAVIISDISDIAVKLIRSDSSNVPKYCVVAQTTFNISKWNFIITELKKQFDKFIYFDTICIATVKRQSEAALVAEKVDFMIVIGDKMSSNTMKLVEICSQGCLQTLLIESYKDLKGVDFKNIEKVGITAGASTPEPVIKEVIKFMSQINTDENTNVTDNFEAMLEESLTVLTSGEVGKGKIIRVDDKGVYIDLGFKYEGFININEFKDQPRVGDEVEAMITKVSDKDCEVLLSKRRIDSKRNVKIIEEAFENKTPIKIHITEQVNGGLVGNISGLSVFVPASQISLRYVEDLTTYLNTDLDVMIITFKKGERNRLKIVGSHKIIAEEERNKKSDEFWSDIQDGKAYKGVVKHITNFGAYVDIGGVDGLVYRSDLSWKKIRHPSEVVSEGQEIEVFVIKFDGDTKKVTLGYKKASENPWNNIYERYNIEDILEVKIVKFVKYGAFAEIEPGLDGLIHISKISNVRLNRPQDALKVGQVVAAKIIGMNEEDKKISLSVKDVEPIDPVVEYEAEPVKTELDEEIKDVEVDVEAELEVVEEIAAESVVKEVPAEIVEAEAIKDLDD